VVHRLEKLRRRGNVRTAIGRPRSPPITVPGRRRDAKADDDVGLMAMFFQWSHRAHEKLATWSMRSLAPT